LKNNFDCRACFAVAKEQVGRDFTPEELLNFFIKASRLMWKGVADEVVLTGGEPTISFYYVLDLLRGLKEFGIGKIELSIFIPNIVDTDEVERIATFLSEVNESIPYHICFAPGKAGVSRRPEKEEMMRAHEIAKSSAEFIKSWKYRYRVFGMNQVLEGKALI